MVKVLGTEQQLETGGIPGPSPINYPISTRNAGASVSGSVLSGLADIANSVVPIIKDRAFGSALAEARETIGIMSASGANAAELQIRRDEIQNKLLRKYGASSQRAIESALTVGPDREITDASGNTHLSDSKGNYYGTTQKADTYANMVETTTMKQIGNLEVDLPNFTKVGGSVIETVMQYQAESGVSLDGGSIADMIDNLSGTVDQVETIHHKALRNMRSASSQSASEFAVRDAQLRIRNLIFSKLDEFDNPMFRNILRNEKVPIDHMALREMPRQFVNDMLDNMQEMDTFNQLGIDRVKFEQELNGEIETLTTFYEKGLTANNSDLDAHATAMKLRRQIRDEGIFADIANNDPELYNLITVSDSLDKLVRVRSAMVNIRTSVTNTPAENALTTSILGLMKRLQPTIARRAALDGDIADPQSAAAVFSAVKTIMKDPDSLPSERLKAVETLLNNAERMKKYASDEQKLQIDQAVKRMQSENADMMGALETKGVTEEDVNEAGNLMEKLGSYFSNQNINRPRPQR